jgi:hypothetical protein
MHRSQVYGTGCKRILRFRTVFSIVAYNSLNYNGRRGPVLHYRGRRILNNRSSLDCMCGQNGGWLLNNVSCRGSTASSVNNRANDREDQESNRGTDVNDVAGI